MGRSGKERKRWAGTVWSAVFSQIVTSIQSDRCSETQVGRVAQSV